MWQWRRLRSCHAVVLLLSVAVQKKTFRVVARGSCESAILLQASPRHCRSCPSCHATSHFCRYFQCCCLANWMQTRVTMGTGKKKRDAECAFLFSLRVVCVFPDVTETGSTRTWT
uniref:Putative secreted protein n=1 Tax=Ixodes ricinus TaxID=34613 RepID=A0A6B0UKV7_IXORI